MGSEPDEPNSRPELLLFSLQGKPPDHPGMLTPPIQTSASIPFLWEEAPGKPRHSSTETDRKPKTARSLELPPRLQSEAKITNTPSPTTVLDGPYVGRALTSSLSFRIPQSWVKKLEINDRGNGSSGGVSGGSLGSKRWGSFRKSKEVNLTGGSLDFSAADVKVAVAANGGGDTKVKITRVKRKGSLLSLPHTRSHLLANIYESFKQAVPWRRRQERLRKMGQ